MIKQVFEVSKAVPNRTINNVFMSLSEEVGELATEISIQDGYSTKPVGKDGIIGESVDVIACALDLIWVHNPEITEEEIMELLSKKLKKWKEKKT